MKARAFKAEDLEQINTWYLERGEGPWPPPLVPLHGVIVDGMACVFVYKTDGGIALIEGLVSNPSADKIQRALAVKTVVKSATKLAKRLCPKVIVITNNMGVSRVSDKLGYKSLGVFEVFEGR